jgi:hypothetical protein
VGQAATGDFGISDGLRLTNECTSHAEADSLGFARADRIRQTAQPQPFWQETAMSYLSLLLSSQSHGMSRPPAGVCVGKQYESFSPTARPDAGETTGSGTSRPVEQALPLGIASMEHWLDLNA